jgi:uncharacterized membrane protein YeaQ/YmgE (transglycosylase-associated protein family)
MRRRLWHSREHHLPRDLVDRSRRVMSARIGSAAFWQIWSISLHAAAGTQQDFGAQQSRSMDDATRASHCPGRSERRTPDMEGNAAVGWIAAIVIGAIAGWLAEQFMKSNMGLLMNIVLGIVGAAIASAILGIFGISFGGWIGYLIAGFIGACILIAVARMFQRTT